MKNKLLLCSAAACCSTVGLQAAENGAGRKADKPNIIIIMVDDMGYSDIGCYGGEIPTPNIDGLASQGVRFSNFYNTGRSCPSRASLLTGLYAHQAGIGRMSEDPNSKRDPQPYGYQGYLNRDCVTIAEVLKTAGYDTYMSGKWHVGMHGEDKWPLQRGFDRFYGILAGACSYLRPDGGRGLTLDNERLPAPEGDYYTTDAFTDFAIQCVKERKQDKPFFLYLPYNAPHWPLHAKPEDIGRFYGKYNVGWQKIRSDRYERMKESGLIPEDCGLAEWESRQWDELTPEQKAASAFRMAVYAAQISCVDQNVGRLLAALDETGQRENTVIMFLSDNGACAEPYSETGSGTIADINNPANWNKPSYGLPWAQVSNTPFRKYKVRAYEGGISTPLIVNWRKGIGDRHGEIVRAPGHIIDLMATCVDLSGARYPKKFHGGNAIHPLEGRSIMPAIEKGEEIHDYIYGEHFNNRFVRHGKWKALMDEKTQKWELYDIDADRAETRDLATERPEILNDLVARWDSWAESHNIYPRHIQK